MFIREFYAKFASQRERSRLFEALRLVSRLDKQILLAGGGDVVGWPEWPPHDPESPGLRPRKA